MIVRGVEYKLQQVFLNLFLNARDAMPKGGWLSVSSRDRRRRGGRRGRRHGRRHSVGAPRAHLRPVLHDEGREGRGTGLGLSVTYGIVQEHGGTLTCESDTSQGTRFRLVLPLAEPLPGRGCRSTVAFAYSERGSRVLMAPSPASVLVIDDEEIIREALEALLVVEGYQVVDRRDRRPGARCRSGDRPVDAVLLDLMLPDRNGLEVLEDIRRLDDELPVVMITAFGTIESAVAATKQGAFYYFTKPFKNDEVLAVVRNAIERRRLVLENRELRDRLRSDSHRFDEIIGGSSKIRAVYDLIARAAPSRATVLIQGESGTGKELVARRFIAGPRAPTRRSSPSTPATCRRICSSRTSSAT